VFDRRQIRKHGRTAQALVLSVREASALGGPRFDVEAMQRRTAQLKWDTHHQTHSPDRVPEDRTQEH
jgi:hypothetical protein